MSTTPAATSYHNSRKFSILLPFRAIQNLSFHYETPCTTVPLTRISCNTVFSKSQNAHKAGTLCNYSFGSSSQNAKNLMYHKITFLMLTHFQSCNKEKNAHLFNICEPVPPSRFMQVICDLMFVNLGIVELRSVPTANTVICAEITLDFKMIDG